MSTEGQVPSHATCSSWEVELIEKILLAIDDSGHSGRVVVVAAELASKLGGEVIVHHCVGSHGVSNLAGILLGSVAKKVLQLANLPVLVVQ